MPAPEPQAVLTRLTEAAIFLTLTAEEGAEDVTRDLLADVSGLRRSVGFRIPEAELSCVVGVGSALWDRLFGGPPRAYIRSARSKARSTPRPPRLATYSSTSARTGSTSASSWRAS